MTNTKCKLLGLSPEIRSDRTPGPLGKNDAADLDLRFCLAGDTPGPVGMGHDSGSVPLAASERVELRPFVIGSNATLRLLQSVATMVALDKLTVIKGGATLPNHNTGPFPTLDQLAITLIAGEMLVETGDPGQIDLEKSRLMKIYIQEFVGAIASGSQATAKFFIEKDALKARAKLSIDAKFAKAQQYNSTRVSAAKTMVASAAVVKFQSTVVLKTAAIFAGWAGFGVELGFEIITDAIGDYNKSKDSNAVVVIVESALDETSSEMSEEIQTELVEKSTEKWDSYVNQLDHEISKLSRQVQEKRGNRKKRQGQAKRLASAEARAAKVAGSRAGLSGAAKRSGALKFAGKSVGWAFWADDVLEAYGELIETLESTK